MDKQNAVALLYSAVGSVDKMIEGLILKPAYPLTDELVEEPLPLAVDNTPHALCRLTAFDKRGKSSDKLEKLLLLTYLLIS